MQADQVGSSPVDQCQSGICSHTHIPSTIWHFYKCDCTLLYIKEVLLAACTDPNGAKLGWAEPNWTSLEWRTLTAEDKQPSGNIEVERLCQVRKLKIGTSLKSKLQDIAAATAFHNSLQCSSGLYSWLRGGRVHSFDFNSLVQSSTFAEAWDDLLTVYRHISNFTSISQFICALLVFVPLHSHAAAPSLCRFKHIRWQDFPPLA